ncbi:TPA: T3SS regulon anti-activator ExsD family protein [Morganella morganii subsp. morganii]|nr:T3SS regulon anti-activator ExsD family protein [Morganella morganii subsp. morganii]HDU8651852.1 T3SS regulon anti-activator ExsD family protein [Morganella morganii subsp. morganii]
MLNKTMYHLYLSDDRIYNSEDACKENDLLSEYLTRQQADNLKTTDWFRRRKKWNIPFQYHDLTMIRQTIQTYPDNWDACLSDTIILSASRYWIDGLLNETYEYWIKDTHRELWDLEEEYNRRRIINRQLAALHALYSAYYPQTELSELSDIKNSFAESAQDLSRTEHNIHTLRGEISFTLRHFVNLFRDVIYHHKSLQDNRIPDYFRTAVQLILQLKNNNDDDRLYQWLNSRNICLTTDKIHWC